MATHNYLSLSSNNGIYFAGSNNSEDSEVFKQFE